MRAAVKLGVLVALATAAGAGRAMAFGAEGHRVVGAIAEGYLCDGARALTAPLLEGATLANAGVWADAIRDDPAWAHTKPWHYIDVADGVAIASVRDPAGNVLTAIERSERDLADRKLPPARRAEALRFFVHFVADVHQPLHVGRPGDRGGNDVRVRWGREQMTLHEFWDAGALLDAEGLGSRDLARAVAAMALGEERAWIGGGPLDWAEESRALRPVVYDLPSGGGRVRLGGAYVAAARGVVSLRLAQAGVRLAWRLNRIGCPAGPALRNPPAR